MPPFAAYVVGLVVLAALASLMVLLTSDRLRCTTRHCVRGRWHRNPHRDRYGREWTDDDEGVTVTPDRIDRPSLD